MDGVFPEKSAPLLYRTVSPDFYTEFLYVLVGCSMLTMKTCIKCVYRMGSSQRLPQIMRAWDRMRNFIILKRICGFKG